MAQPESSTSNRERGKRVAIIGAGPSGLVAIKECLAMGLTPVCFERKSASSMYGQDPSHFKSRKTLNTSKSMMQFSDYPVPEHWPEFLSHAKVDEYLQMYSKEFGLEKYIKYGRSVLSVKPQMSSDSDHQGEEIHNGKWEIIYRKKEKKSAKSGSGASSANASANSTMNSTVSANIMTSTPCSSFIQSPPPSRPESPDDQLARDMTSLDINRGVSIDYNPDMDDQSHHLEFPEIEKILPPSAPTKPKRQCKRDVFEFVMVCTGHSWSPNQPTFKGMEEFGGRIIHSASYKVPYPFKDEKVLVVGVGNSGMSVSQDLGPHAETLFVSSRSGAWITPRTTFFGIPTDHLSTRAVHSIPRFVLNYALESLVKLHHGDMQRYGLQPTHKFLEATPVVGTGVLGMIETGKVVVKPDITQFTNTGVEFSDGSWESVDSVILCTGYTVMHNFIGKHVTGRLYKHVFSPTYDGVAFIGFVRPNGSLLPVAELQARWAARVFAEKLEIPSRKERRDVADLDWMQHCTEYADKERFDIAVDQVAYMDSIAERIGCKPDLWKLWSDRTNWGLALRVSFGPVISAQYRLFGEGEKREIAELEIARACAGIDFGKRVEDVRGSTTA